MTAGAKKKKKKLGQDLIMIELKGEYILLTVNVIGGLYFVLLISELKSN